jgi:uncharacterized protein
MIDNRFAEARQGWESGRAKTVSFIVTQDCQLRCRYCYNHGKNPHSRMPFDVARTTVDYLIGNPRRFPDPAVIWEFIGGEPLLEIELVDRVCDHAKRRMYEAGHPWFESYRINLTTNGIRYGDRDVQRFIAKNQRHLSITVTLDGTRAKHDLNRVYASGAGSYDDVIRNVPLWLSQFPESSTKVTLSSPDLPHTRASVLHLWGLGIKNVNINVVFENVWQEGDDRIYEEQLCRLADDIVRDKLYERYWCSFFSRHVGTPVTDDRNWCGVGKMLSVDARGTFYPCTRFAPHCLRNRPARSVGNCIDGIDENRLRPFLTLSRRLQSPAECNDCEVAGGCAWCQGENYDSAESDTIWQRATHLCKMHKARVRANRYFFERLESLGPEARTR